MINAFSVGNFRAFEQSGDLPLSLLTCLVGRNSSGKSSIIQALLLLRQSIEQRAIGSRVPQLNLTGPLVDAGSFADVVHGHDTSRDLAFHLQLDVDLAQPRHLRSPQTSLVELDIPSPSANRYWIPGFRTLELLQQQGQRRPRKVSLSFFFRPEPPFGPALSRLHVAVEGLGSASFVRTTGERRVQHWRSYVYGLPKRAIHISFPLWSFFPVLSDRPLWKQTVRQARQPRMAEFVATAQRALLETQVFLSQLKLLGPFRTPPARHYAFSGLGAADTGISGERAVDLLVADKLLRAGNEPLRMGVAFWLRKLGLARGLTVKDVARKSNMFELSVSGAGTARSANFADVGFGISQVLPVLVQGFLVPRGGTYVVQQPELHLHPDAQAGLADFFLYLASQGVRSLIETHSEYLLLRLRRRLAEGVRPTTVGIPAEKAGPATQLSKSSVSVVYVMEGGSSSSLVPLQLGDSFQFENLPEGFMSQAIDDRIALMKALRTK